MAPLKQCAPTSKLLLTTVQSHIRRKEKIFFWQGLSASSGKHLWLLCLFLVLFMARGHILHFLCILFLHQFTICATHNSQRLLPKESPVLQILHIPSSLNVLLLMLSPQCSILKKTKVFHSDRQTLHAAMLLKPSLFLCFSYSDKMTCRHWKS